MFRSLSEIDTNSKRASRAVGFSWGEAEEIGKSVKLLELFGFQKYGFIGSVASPINRKIMRIQIWGILIPVSYTHLTLPTNREV